MNTLDQRIAQLQELLSWVVPVPEAWLTPGNKRAKGKSGNDLAPIHCESYREVMTAWRKALRWRKEMDDVLTVMLAVAMSTSQIGDQLFLQVIADAGSAKTRFCDALLVSKTCHALEHLTGFHSGWKDGSGEDFSLISRINHKTLITSEGDVLMSSPRFAEIMSQQRRIFDGKSGATYKNAKEDLLYSGLRTPWIMAGTPALMDTDQSRLGDRFLRICIEAPDIDEKRQIAQRVGFMAFDNVIMKSDGKAESQMNDRIREAYQLTGGYLDYLRSNSSELLSELTANSDIQTAVDQCSVLAEFTADCRASPNPDAKKDSHPTKEMFTRLQAQFCRLAACVPVVQNKKEIDSGVIDIVRKVALDTGRGKSLELVKCLYKVGQAGSEIKPLAIDTHSTEEKVRNLLRFMRHSDIGIVELFHPTIGNVKGKALHRLTPRMFELYQQVYEQ